MQTLLSVEASKLSLNDSQALNRSQNGSINNGRAASPKLESQYWKTRLYQLQEIAPNPKIVPRLAAPSPPGPAHYGLEYHGYLDKDPCMKLLQQNGEGSLLNFSTLKFITNR